jgi:hypothetical protein
VIRGRCQEALARFCTVVRLYRVGASAARKASAVLTGGVACDDRAGEIRIGQCVELARVRRHASRLRQYSASGGRAQATVQPQQCSVEPDGCWTSFVRDWPGSACESGGRDPALGEGNVLRACAVPLLVPTSQGSATAPKPQEA